MLRLELKDNDDTVLFLNPMNGVQIHKQMNLSSDVIKRFGIRIVFATCGSCELMHTIVCYPDPGSRDAVYESILAKINEYLFPQIDSVEKGIDLTEFEDMLIHPIIHPDRYDTGK